MAITITAYSAGIDVTAYLNTFVSPNYAPFGFGYFSSEANDFSGNQYASTEQSNLIPNTNDQSVVFESGGGVPDRIQLHDPHGGWRSRCDFIRLPASPTKAAPTVFR